MGFDLVRRKTRSFSERLPDCPLCQTFTTLQHQQSVWEPSAELPTQQLAALPGAAKYLSAWHDPGQAGGGGNEGQVQASRILCKHVGSRRASGWQEVSAVVDAR